MKAVAIGFVGLCLAAPVCEAQAAHGMTAACPNELKRVLSASQGQDSAALRGFLSFNQSMDCMTALLLTQTSSVVELLTDRAEAVRAALQQNGTSAGSGNSTNLVSKGTAAQVLSLASEYGGLTEATSGQTVTLSGSLGGVPTALIRNGLLSNCGGINVPGAVCLSSNTVNALNRVSYSVSFNASSTAQTVSGTSMSSSGSTSTAQPATFTASTNTVSSTTTKVVLLRGAAASINDTVTAINKLSPTSSISKAPAAQMAQAKKDFTDLADKELKVGAPKDALEAWRAATAEKIIKAGPENAIAVWQQQATALMNALCPATGPATCRTNLLHELVEYAVFVNGYKAGVNAYVEGLRKAPLLTFEYD